MDGKEMTRITDSILSMALMAWASPKCPIYVQGAKVESNLPGLNEGDGLRVFNRHVSHFEEGTRKGLRFDKREGDGLAYVTDLDFGVGSIEFDVRGEDVLQNSFVGLAFHGVDGSTFEAVYFRPFNFRSDVKERRSHAIQYIFHPTYPWKRLRTEHPGEFERVIERPPDPNSWFHVRVNVGRQKVEVFVDSSKQPSMVIRPLGKRKKGLIGFWVGDGSGGDFANLSVHQDNGSSSMVKPH